MARPSGAFFAPMEVAMSLILALIQWVLPRLWGARGCRRCISIAFLRFPSRSADRQGTCLRRNRLHRMYRPGFRTRLQSFGVATADNEPAISADLQSGKPSRSILGQPRNKQRGARSAGPRLPAANDPLACRASRQCSSSRDHESFSSCLDASLCRIECYPNISRICLIKH
jgi:hypothetical protein